jgi:hypothetical protein
VSDELDKLFDEAPSLTDDDAEALFDAAPAYEPKTMADSALSGAAQGASLGFADEAAAGAGAVYDYLGGKLGLRGDISLKDAYKSYLPHIREADKKAKADNPYTYGGAELAGMIATPSPVKGSGLGKAIGQGALMGGVAGAGYSEGETLGDVALDASLSAAMGGAAGGVIGGAGKALGALKPSNLKQVAGERAVKSVTGQNLKAIRNLRNTGAADASGDALEQAGRHLLSVDEAGAPVVKAFRKSEDLLEPLKVKKADFGKKIGDVASEIDKEMPNAVSGNRIAQKIREYAGNMAETESTKPVIKRLMREADNFEKRGNMSFAEAQKLKGSFKFKPQDSSTHTFGQDASNQLNSILRREMNDTAKLISDIAPDGSKLKDLTSNYVGYKGKYQTYKTLEEAAQKRADANLSNRFGSPTDYGAGGLGVLATIGSGGTALPAVLYGLAAGMANKLARERGSSTAAAGLNSLAKVLEKSPQSLQKFGKVITDAAQRGQGALVVTHSLLMKDPLYQKILEDAQ